MDILRNDCHKCIHREVCKVYDDYQGFVNTVSEVLVDAGQNRFAKLTDIPWVRVSLQCSHYLPDETTKACHAWASA